MWMFLAILFFLSTVALSVYLIISSRTLGKMMDEHYNNLAEVKESLISIGEEFVKEIDLAVENTRKIESQYSLQINGVRDELRSAHAIIEMLLTSGVDEDAVLPQEEARRLFLVT